MGARFDHGIRCLIELNKYDSFESLREFKPNQRGMLFAVVVVDANSNALSWSGQFPADTLWWAALLSRFCKGCW